VQRFVNKYLTKWHFIFSRRYSFDHFQGYWIRQAMAEAIIVLQEVTAEEEWIDCVVFNLSVFVEANHQARW